MDSITFWSTFFGAGFGALFAFTLAYVRDHLNNIHVQMAALNSAQMNLANQASYIQAFQEEFINEAKRIAKRGDDWRTLVRRPAGRPPLLLDRQSLNFLLDKRFLKKTRDFENIYIEIIEAASGFEIAYHMIELFARAKESLESVAIPVPDGKGLEENRRTIEVGASGIRFVYDMNSSLDTFEKLSEKTSKDLLASFDRIDKLFQARWHKSSGIVLRNRESVTKTVVEPRVAYGIRYR